MFAFVCMHVCACVCMQVKAIISWSVKSGCGLLLWLWDNGERTEGGGFGQKLSSHRFNCMERNCCTSHPHGVTEHPRGAIFSCFHGNSMGYHENMQILLPWGVPIHHIFYSDV